MRPLCIDLFCGLGGWTDGFLAEGWDVVGFDIERHEYDGEKYPAQLVLQDVLTIHGKQFRDASMIVASSPCQEYSYMAMPFSRGKQIAAALRGQGDFPDGYEGSRTPDELNALFHACRRIQREACEAAGRCIPMVQENVKGAQPWVGKAQWHYGSYYLWGDVPALMPVTMRAQKANPDGSQHGVGSWFAVADSKNRGASEGTKNPGFRFDGSGRSFQSESVERHTKNEGVKIGDRNAHRASAGRLKSARFTNADEQPTVGDGRKGFAARFEDTPMARFGSKSSARKAASARIAKIPFALASHIARVYKPHSEVAA